MTSHAKATERVRRSWDAAAPRYDASMAAVERWLFPGGREWVCSRASGDVLEIAVGTGRNFPHYPPGIRLTGIELSPQMLAEARRAAAMLGIAVDLVEANAEALPFADASYDTVVCTLSLCAIPDDEAAIREMWRVLRPGGKLLLLDHVASDRWPIRALQRLIDVVSVRSAGEHFSRRPLPLLERAGFQIAEAERSKAGIVERVAAVKPLG